MFTKKMATTLTMMGLIASTSGAQTDAASTGSTTMTTPTYNHMNVNDPVGWFPFLGVSGGYMSRTRNEFLGTEGAPTEVRLMGSYFNETRRSVIDIGLGFMGDEFSQKSDVRNNFISGGVAEAAWRFNTASRWQFGPIVDAYYTGDNNRFGSTDPNWASFGGLQILKEFAVGNKNMVRVGVKALTDLSVPREDLNTVMLDLQWGFGATQAAPQVSEADRAPAVTTALAAPAPADASGSNRVMETDADAGTLTIRNEDRLQFDSGTSGLAADNSEFIQSVGTAIANHGDLFDQVEVVGFADASGSNATNMRISKERAQSVATLLRESGVDRTKITSSWKGANEPMYQSLLPEDQAQNRRVDIIFHGVKDQAALEDALNTVW
jgi:OOP family OmpA-OmpF porin